MMDLLTIRRNPFREAEFAHQCFPFLIIKLTIYLGGTYHKSNDMAGVKVRRFFYIRSRQPIEYAHKW